MKGCTALSLLFFISTATWGESAQDIIRLSDAIRSPDNPFRYTVTVLEYPSGSSEPRNKQILDISMRFLKPEGNRQAEARSLVRFIFPARDKGKVMLSDWYDLWFYTPELRRPVPISRQQRLLGQIANGDVIVTNFEDAYNARLLDEQPCGVHICYQLDLQRKSSQVTWPKVKYLVEKGSYRPYKASYYSLDDKLMKEVEYRDYKPLLGKVRPAQIVVTDTRHGNGYSVMEYSDLRYESLPASEFTRESIQRGDL
ncbi:outer membrane lipoprotein-sorting protein [Pantoea phytobeneficialis]|uniref:Outer membrane lipoprotein-sorting protein n=1 Tax=Pantoea phytobeneficialis TaxID=2052056 RepID=A0AAP9H586_9GAMM|nr:outer membrane lipoprotein-sorting protein [Pantoea phytobeneficialis]MDO6406132.1 outer membrane lipoprotein-sorting protein [Pantoea phytobeneficialis]QGR06556.1 outer membrane lipoprotein-sorting protein [Pantoea phytobeneficialis]